MGTSIAHLDIKKHYTHTPLSRLIAVSVQVQLHMLLHTITLAHTWFQLAQYAESVPSVRFTTSFLPSGSGIMDIWNGPGTIPGFYTVAVSILVYLGVFSTRAIALYAKGTHKRSQFMSKHAINTLQYNVKGPKTIFNSQALMNFCTESPNSTWLLLLLFPHLVKSNTIFVQDK